MNPLQKLVFKYSDKLLNICEHRDDFTQSDMQGAIQAQLTMMAREAQDNITRSNWEKVGFKNDWGLER